jgi:hypothetical protein
MFKKKKSLEPFSYFGHNWRRITQIEIKFYGFFCSEEIYKSSSEGHWPFLLEFFRKFKTMVFKDLGPVQ